MRRRPQGLSLGETLEWFGITLDCDPVSCLRPRRVARWRGSYYSVKYEGRAVFLHRLALELRLGRPIRPGLVSRHRCGHDWCANPWHLLEGTHAENMADQYEHGTRVAGEGHPGARLSDGQVDEIRSQIASGDADGAIASRYSVSRQCVNDIRHGRRRQRLASN